MLSGSSSSSSRYSRHKFHTMTSPTRMARRQTHSSTSARQHHPAPGGALAHPAVPGIPLVGSAARRCHALCAFAPLQAVLRRRGGRAGCGPRRLRLCLDCRRRRLIRCCRHRPGRRAVRICLQSRLLRLGRGRGRGPRRALSGLCLGRRALSLGSRRGPRRAAGRLCLDMRPRGVAGSRADGWLCLFRSPPLRFCHCRRCSGRRVWSALGALRRRRLLAWAKRSGQRPAWLCAQLSC
jgi:hypothetical protein